MVRLKLLVTRPNRRMGSTTVCIHAYSAMELPCKQIVSAACICTIRVSEAAVLCSFLESLPPGRNWNIPKVMAMAAFPESIRQLGSADVASTGLGEATHKGLKQSAKLSNRHEDSHLAQVRASCGMCGSPE